MTVIRWLLVIPVAVVGGGIAQLVTIVITAFLPDALSQLVGSVSVPIGFILLGARVAPMWKVHVAAILALLMVLFYGVYLGWALIGLAGQSYSPVVVWLSVPLGTAASVIGIYIVYNVDKRRRTDHIENKSSEVPLE